MGHDQVPRLEPHRHQIGAKRFRRERAGRRGEREHERGREDPAEGATAACLGERHLLKLPAGGAEWGSAPAFGRLPPPSVHHPRGRCGESLI